MCAQKLDLVLNVSFKDPTFLEMDYVHGLHLGNFRSFWEHLLTPFQPLWIYSDGESKLVLVANSVTVVGLHLLIF